MSASNTDLFRTKLKAAQDVIKAQHCLPKSERNQRDIDLAKKQIETYKRWLGDDTDEPKAKPVVKKTEFREQYKSELDIQEPQDIIRIENLTMLDKVWPAIAGKNIQVEAPAEVKAEIRKRVREMHRKQKVNGFR